MYKKILALCLTIAIVMSTAMTPVFADSFNFNFSGNLSDKNFLSLFKPGKDKDDHDDKVKDVIKKFFDSEDVDWAEKSIEKLGAMGIINGFGDGLFKPKNNVTHAEAIAMVLKLKGQREEAEAIKTQPEYFKGISDNWSWGYLQLALNEGIIVPEEDGWFNPKTPAKRHEIAKYVVRALDKRDEALKNMNAKLSFKDTSSIPRTSRGYVYVITELGIMQGSKSEFQPNKPITRAEMAVLLDRAAGKLDDEIIKDNALEGIFIALDKNNGQMTLNIDNKQVVYKVNAYAPVYRNNTYYTMDTLMPGDLIEIVLDSNKNIIFIEFKESSTQPQEGQLLTTQRVQYENLTPALKGKIDALKLNENYAAFRDEQYIYLIAARGQMNTGGYTIRINEVYAEAIQTSKYNLKAVVEKEYPSGQIVTQAITYPYDIVRLPYFDSIDKINFVDTENNILRQTTLNALDAVTTINGKINAIDAANRIIYVKESDNVIRAYFIPANVQITLNNNVVALSALTENMTVVITKTNDIVTKIAAENADNVVVINGKISSVDVANRIIFLKESDNAIRAYYIPANAQIVLTNRNVTLSALKENMPAAITKTNGIVTKIVAEKADAVEIINGKISTVDAANRILYVKDTTNTVRAYFIPANAEITLVNRTVALSALTENMPVAITRTNGSVTKVAAQNADAVEVINGKINSVDAANRIVYLKESDNVVRAYFIPANAQITLDNVAVAITALAENMTLTITRTNGEITKLAAQRTADTVEVINGKISSVDTANRIVYLKESDNVVRTYYIPSNILITLNNTAVALSALTENMTLAITRTNGEITKLAATQTVQTINGKIESVDTSSNTVRILESNNAVNAYVIPANAQITLNGTAANLSSLTKGMTAVITKIDGVITSLVVQNNVQMVEGILVNIYPSQNNTTIRVKVGNNFVQYITTPETAVFYNNSSIAMHQMPLNTTLTIKIVNELVTEVRNK